MRLILRRDEFQRFWSCLVFVPRERCDADVRAAHRATAAAALCTARNWTRACTLGEEPLAQLHVLVRVDPSGTPARCRSSGSSSEIAAALISWRDRLRAALRARFGEAPRRRARAPLWRRAFPLPIARMSMPRSRVDDIERPRRLDTAPEHDAAAPLPSGRAGASSAFTCASCAAARRCRSPRCCRRFEHFGLRVIAERPYRLELARWRAASGSRTSSSSTTHRALRWPRRASARELIAAFRAVRAGELDDDGFNRLLIAVRAAARQVTVLRACCRYLLQTGIPFSQSYMERVLAAHAATARALVAAVRAAPHAQASRRDSATRARQLEQHVRARDRRRQQRR